MPQLDKDLFFYIEVQKFKVGTPTLTPTPTPTPPPTQPPRVLVVGSGWWGGGEGGGGGGGGDRVVIVLTFCSAAETPGFKGVVVSGES